MSIIEKLQYWYQQDLKYDKPRYFVSDNFNNKLVMKTHEEEEGCHLQKILRHKALSSASLFVALAYPLRTIMSNQGSLIAESFLRSSHNDIAVLTLNSSTCTILDSDNYDDASYTTDVQKIHSFFDNNRLRGSEYLKFLEDGCISTFSATDKDLRNFDTVLSIVENNNKLLKVENFITRKVNESTYEQQSCANFRKIWLLLQIVGSMTFEMSNSDDYKLFRFWLGYDAVIDTNGMLTRRHPLAVLFSKRAYEVVDWDNNVNRIIKKQNTTEQ